MFFDEVFDWIRRNPQQHVRTGAEWQKWANLTKGEVERSFSSPDGKAISFGPFGTIRFPFHTMGSITSLDLFGLDELIIFSFYNANRATYKKVLDCGANIGLHTIMLAKAGYNVRSFEPDPKHIELLRRNLELNGVQTDLHQAAISLADGTTEFVRVVGNTTGSHIAGAKANPYGQLDCFSVKVEAAAPHLAWADLAKIDIEGHEAVLIPGINPSIWNGTDAFIEIGTPENADAVFAFLHEAKVGMFSQKSGWNKVGNRADMPTSHREGSLFISNKPAMQW